MLTESELRDAFIATTFSEPVAESWSDFKKFARKVESLVEEKFKKTRDKIWKEWMELAVQAQRNAVFFANLLNECAKYLGPEVY